MTDPNLAEQAEREIAEELGFTLKDYRGISYGDWAKMSHPGHPQAPVHHTTTEEIALWQALVRDRCSLLKLRKAANELMPFIWEANMAKSAETEFEKKAAALICALEGK